MAARTLPTNTAAPCTCVQTRYTPYSGVYSNGNSDAEEQARPPQIIGYFRGTPQLRVYGGMYDITNLHNNAVSRQAIGSLGKGGIAFCTCRGREVELRHARWIDCAQLGDQGRHLVRSRLDRSAVDILEHVVLPAGGVGGPQVSRHTAVGPRNKVPHVVCRARGGLVSYSFPESEWRQAGY